MAKINRYVNIPNRKTLKTDLPKEEVEKVFWHLRNRKYTRVDSGMGMGVQYADGFESSDSQSFVIKDGSKYTIHRNRWFNLETAVTKITTTLKKCKEEPLEEVLVPRAYYAAPTALNPPDIFNLRRMPAILPD